MPFFIAKSITKMFKFLRNKRIRHWFISMAIILATVHVGVYLYQLFSSSALVPALTTGDWQEADVIHFSTSSVLQKVWKPESELVIVRYTKYFQEVKPTVVLKYSDCDFLKRIYWKPAQPTGGIFNVPCRITFSKDYLKESHALVFHSVDLLRESPPEVHRDTAKVWVYLQQESPLFTIVKLNAYNGIFNWTMTYRRDSDVYHPYGYLVELPRPEEPQPMFKKTGLVAWIVSNCNALSKRELFVNELRKHIQVDIFGRCGRPCAGHDCYAFVAPRYKFFLSLENALCTDYITEKFFKALKYGMVPIVYGGSAAEDYSVVSPNHSYIDAGSFDSPKQLAEYLHFLDRNEKEYMRYFDWKIKYGIHDPNWCNLCQRVYEHFSAEADSRTTRWYKDIWKWWNFKRVEDNGGRVKNAKSKSMCVHPPAKLTQS